MRLQAIPPLARAVACGPATPGFQGSDATGAAFGPDSHLAGKASPSMRTTCAKR